MNVVCASSLSPGGTIAMMSPDTLSADTAFPAWGVPSLLS